MLILLLSGYNNPVSENLQTITLAGGCFWCTEAIFKRLKGVITVTPGYAGGTLANPNWEQVYSGRTGHAEAIQIRFDPKIISLEKILDVFWATHDPTSLNKQMYDTGPQYRSAIFYHDENQKSTIEKSKENLEKSGKLSKPVVTQIVPFTVFYSAEGFHKDYYDKNRTAPYCRIIIDPKIQKLLQEFPADVKA